MNDLEFWTIQQARSAIHVRLERRNAPSSRVGAGPSSRKRLPTLLAALLGLLAGASALAR
jgi:hypothetical protein